MTKYLFIENGMINGCGEALRAETEVINIEVNEEIYNNYLSTPQKYIYNDGKIIQNPEYENLKRQAEINEKISLITQELDELDKKRIRAVCENSVKDIQSGQTWLEYYNIEVNNLRNKITELAKSITK